MQKLKQKESIQSTSILQDLVEKQKSTRIITVQYKSCCGCGCSYEDYNIEVPSDSDIQDGDIVSYNVIEKYHR